MELIQLQQVAGGALQENAQKAIEEVIRNMQDPNTPWKNKRKVIIEMRFTQNEERNDSHCELFVDKKLAPVRPIETKFSIGTDLENGTVYAEEYGPQIKGQMRLDDYTLEQVIDGQVVDTDTGEILENDKVMDFRNIKQA